MIVIPVASLSSSRSKAVILEGVVEDLNLDPRQNHSGMTSHFKNSLLTEKGVRRIKLNQPCRKIVYSGIALCIVTIALGFVFLTYNHSIVINATGAFASMENANFEVTLNKGDITHLNNISDLTIEIDGMNGETLKQKAKVIELSRKTDELFLSIENGAALNNDKRFDVKLILFDKPYWKYLLGGCHCERSKSLSFRRA